MTELQAIYAQRLADSVGSADFDSLASRFASQMPDDPTEWVKQNAPNVIGDDVAGVLEDLYYEAAWVGKATALAYLPQASSKAASPLTSAVNWDNWKPGDSAAAKKLIGTKNGQGLKNLLDNRYVRIKGMNDTQYQRLGNILGHGVKKGNPPAAIAQSIKKHFGGDMNWAFMVARTEVAAAMTASSLDTYQGAGVTQVAWVTAADCDCQICNSYAEMSPVGIDDGFGDLDGPPGHPNCLCVIEPVLDDGYQLPAADSSGNELDAHALDAVNAEGDVTQADSYASGKAATVDAVKADRNVRKQALERLEKIPMVDDEQINVPWPIKKQPKLDPEVWEDSKIKAVEITELYASQKYLKKQRVIWFINNPGAIEPGRRALGNVYATDGSNVIVDGHHRLAAYWLLDAEVANVWFLEE